MKVLIACEYSGRIRDVFLNMGHDAISCDLLPTDVPGPHYQGDVFDIINDGFDLMIAHPPCTYLTNSGVRWLYEKPGRWELMDEAAAFFKRLLDAPIHSIAVENPVMHGHAIEIIGRKQDQIVHPWMFGETQSKATGLWLKNLPLLHETDNVYTQMMALPYKERAKVHYASPGPDRWKERSTTFQGIADAIGTQWS